METIIFTVSVDSIALMPCNPNIEANLKDGIEKGIITEEEFSAKKQRPKVVFISRGKKIFGAINRQ